MTTLTPYQFEQLRRINLATLYGFHSIAKWLMEEYRRQWPEETK